MTEITMPRLSDSMREGTILSWLKADGDAVAVGDELVEIETDKATMAYESPAEGVLEIVAQVGDTLEVGELIAHLGIAGQSGGDATPAPRGAEAATARPVEPAELEPAVETAEASSATDGNGSPRDVRATPLARRMARAHGLDLGELQGTGPGGRITRTDVAERAGVQTGAPAPAPRAVASAPASARVAAAANGTTEQLSRRQQLIARRMAEAKATIPHFQVQTETEVDALLALREQLKHELGEGHMVPSVNDFIVKACALALRQYPRANGSYRDGTFELHERVNIGIAVAAEDALIVPTISDADQRSLGEIAIESRRLAERVRDGSVTPAELSGATFTVSNLGMFGMTAITPVINPPQAAILGVGAARRLPDLVDGRLVQRGVLTLTLSCDHRILYGADAARFLGDISRGLQTPLRLML
jgi:pyruvate dehydrogenase E2 component (dihydrolipoamide acetyltransferase)